MKRSVQSFSVQVIENNAHVDILTDRKKPYKYRIWSDERHPDIFEVARHLNAGLNHAVQHSTKIEITDYLERMYVHINLPVSYHSNQYSAQER